MQRREQRGQHCAASKSAEQQGSSAEQQGKGATRSIAELRREKKPLERPKRERAMYSKELRGGRAMLISPHNVQGRAAQLREAPLGSIQCLRQGMGPRLRLLSVLATEVDAHGHEGREPQAGHIKQNFCHQPRYLPCGPMGSAFNPVRLAGSNALFFL